MTDLVCWSEYGPRIACGKEKMLTFEVQHFCKIYHTTGANGKTRQELDKVLSLYSMLKIHFKG